MPVENALGTIALAADDVTCTDHNSPAAFRLPLAQMFEEDPLKRGKAVLKPEEAVYILATFCFDLTRKMEYIYKALAPYALQADPALAREIFNDNEEMNRAKLSGWKAAAETGQRLIHDIWHQVHEHHETAFRMVLELQPALTGDRPSVSETRDHTPPSRIADHIDALHGNGEDK
jgi:hypothetical protein